MKENIIEELNKKLSNMDNKCLNIKQNGFIKAHFYINKMSYNIKNDILNIKDNDDVNLNLEFNLNQVYKINILENSVLFYLDNDTQIELSI